MKKIVGDSVFDEGIQGKWTNKKPLTSSCFPEKIPVEVLIGQTYPDETRHPFYYFQATLRGTGV